MDRHRYRWFNMNNPYAYRDDNLRRLGFDSYAAYLRSDLWKSIRGRALDRDSFRCGYCGRRAVTAHHRAYDPKTLTGECINALSSICMKCHCRIEEPDNLSRPRWDRLHDSSAKLIKKERKRRKKTTRTAPIWAQHITEPRLVKKGD